MHRIALHYFIFVLRIRDALAPRAGTRRDRPIYSVQAVIRSRKGQSGELEFVLNM